MKRAVCTKCGCKDAADFIFRILCPEMGCGNYDRKLSDERFQENLDESLAELDNEIDFIAGPGFVTPVGHSIDLDDDLDFDDLDLGDLLDDD